MLILSLATVVSACGSDPEATEAEPGLASAVPAAPASSTPSTSSTVVAVSASNDPTAIPTTTAEGVTTILLDEPCDQDRRLLKVAMEAYFAEYGETPATLADLTGDFLREPIGSYALGAGGELERQTEVPCILGNSATEEPAAIETVEEALAYLGGDEFIAGAGGTECATEIAVIMLAGEEYTEVNGADPEELADLDDFLQRKITKWTWQPENGTLVPAPGSGCIDPFTNVDGPTDTAGETVDTVRETIDTLPAPVTTTLPETTYTLEVHTDGCGVFRSGEVGDDLQWVVKDLDGFQVLARNAAGETQYRYYRSGTYTMAIQAWGGGYYVPVSNEVTITC